METTARSRPAPIIGVFGKSKSFIPVRADLRQSASFLSLTASAQIILIDFMWHYLRKSDFDRSRADFTKPILYTWGMCGLLVGRTTFYRVMKQLQRHRFIMPHTTVRRKRGQAHRWRIDWGWKVWQPGHAQLLLLNDYNDRRAASIEDPNQLKLEFVANIRELNKESPTRPDDPQPISDIIPELFSDGNLHHRQNAMTL